MRRQRRVNLSPSYYNDGSYFANTSYAPLNKNLDDENPVEMERLPRIASSENGQLHSFENTIEAKVEVGDSLQALALRFHCTVADIKRLNKIDKDNEIYARKFVKIPVTPHSILLETLPTVHKSGSNSPSQSEHESFESGIMRNPLKDANLMLGEKLIIASVNASGNNNLQNVDTNKSVLASTLRSKDSVCLEKENHSTNDSAALLEDFLDDDFADTYVRPIRGPSISALHWSGSDGDMTWVCLFVVILALCFAIPLIVVIFWTHPHSSANNNATTNN
ncbi:lysM and putative peptidoglycan-binding domain-containing protein 3 isoform X1 [Bactrocera dorsalis]|uniref:LysM and putative peptidoglycan-binding domain-containing protein 3 isoform X1 n=1 Tax=Bactrocera dorsalis TaxID=27457 RepID=A0A6I9VBH9_BACDO|nr:lysM and putative peptidoglycan-binding domain-containing protein 3 isoform X1 [Bactrocera dorsalis]XP_049318088.1 lysM and putative peptidoglycan-binding domain-containing protein 3 isoform X1 [Bactrocera dorsalis]